MNYITVLTTQNPCNKHVELVDGKPVKSAPKNNGAGIARLVHVPDVVAFAKVLQEIGGDPRQCLIQGYARRGATLPEVYQILSRAALARALPFVEDLDGWHEVDGVLTTTRSKANFSPSNWFQIDRDFAPGLPPEYAAYTGEQYLEAINEFCPGIAEQSYVHLASTTGRVTLDGKALDAKGGRYWMQMRNASDYSDFGQRLKFAGLAAGYGFFKKIKGGEVAWSLFDQTVFSWERLVYDGKPTVGPGLGLTGSLITVCRTDAGPYDTTRCEMPGAEAMEAIAREFNLRSASGVTGLQAIATGQLKLSTPVETQQGKMTVQEFLDSGHDKLRCQATFRPSDSWNGVLRRAGGVPILYDNGTRTRYELSDAEKTLLRDGPAKALAEGLALLDPKPLYKTLNAAGLPDLRVGERGPMVAQLATSANITWACEQWGVSRYYDVMRGDHCIEAGAEDPVLLELRLHDELQRLGIKMSRSALHQVMVDAARSDMRHPMEDWLLGLPAWDGIDHVGNLAASVTAPDSPLWPVLLRKWLCQVVTGVLRWRAGGTQLSSVLVLSGAQGLGKSTFFERIVPDGFFMGDAALHLNSSAGKDHQLQVLQTAVTELGELDSTFSKSELGGLKRFISARQDTLRKPYAVAAETRPRMTTFCATVNASEFLRDSTGNRRFWPVGVTHFDYAHQVNLEQLYAQVLHAYNDGETPHLDAAQTAAVNEASEDYRQTTPVEDAFYDFFNETMMEVPEAERKALNMAGIYAMISPDRGALNHPAERAVLSGLLRQHFGPHRKIGGKQKCYLVPTSLTPFDAS